MVGITVEDSPGTKPRGNVPPSVPIANKTLTGQRVDAVDGIFQLVGLGCIMGGQYADAGAIDIHGHGISLEVADLAGKNDNVAKGVDTLLQVGPYAGLVVAVMPLVLQMLVNHKIVPAEKMPPTTGVVEPSVLEAQVKTAMAEQALEALQNQRLAEERLAQMQAEFMAADQSNNGSDPDNG